MPKRPSHEMSKPKKQVNKGYAKTFTFNRHASQNGWKLFCAKIADLGGHMSTGMGLRGPVTVQKRKGR